MTVDYFKPNRVVTSIIAAVPDVGSLLEPVNGPLTPHTQLLTWQMLDFFLEQSTRTIGSSLLLPLRANSTCSQSCPKSMPTLLLFATI